MTLTTAQRRGKQVDAAVALLQTFTDEQLRDVMARLGTRGVVLEQPEPVTLRVCGVCGFAFHKCRRLATSTGDDHAFEATTKTIK